MTSHRYLYVWADHNSTGLFDEFESEVRPGDVELSADIWRDLGIWVKKYAPIVPLMPAERKECEAEINALDEEGIGLAELIAKHLDPNHKVGYYSEGKQAKLRNNVTQD